MENPMLVRPVYVHRYIRIRLGLLEQVRHHRRRKRRWFKKPPEFI